MKCLQDKMILVKAKPLLCFVLFCFVFCFFLNFWSPKVFFGEEKKKKIILGKRKFWLLGLIVNESLEDSIPHLSINPTFSWFVFFSFSFSFSFFLFIFVPFFSSCSYFSSPICFFSPNLSSSSPFLFSPSFFQLIIFSSIHKFL